MTHERDTGRIQRLTPREVAGLIETAARTHQPLALVDVREPQEYAGGHLPGSLHIPLGTLEERLDEIPRDRAVVFICRSGGRSMSACQIALAAGIPSPSNLEGGLRAWAQEVDPALVVL